MFTNMQITDIITSQNLLFDLAEREADRNGFKHDPRVERQLSSHPLWFNQMELTVKAPCGLTLDFEAKRPAKNPLPEVQCTVKFGVFRNKRGQKATPLGDHVSTPDDTGHGAISWHKQDGASYTPQELCDLAFERLREQGARC
jgi:hypothetical protein